MTNAALRPSGTARFTGLSKAVPFATAEEAWFWTMSALTARRDGARIVAGRGNVVRPCEPDDVVKCLDRLYRQRRIDLTHARILRIWGERGERPSAHHARERHDHAIWQQALSRMDWPLRLKGIVAGDAAAGFGVEREGHGCTVVAFDALSRP